MDIALVRSTKEDIGIDDAFARYTELEGDIICPHCLGGIHIKKSNLPLKKQDRYFSHNPNIELICPAKQVNLQYFGATSNSDYHKTQEVFSFIMKNREARKAMVYVLQSIIYGFSYKELDKCAVLARDKGTLGSRNLLYRDLPYVLSTFRTFKPGEDYKRERIYYFRCYFLQDTQSGEINLYRRTSLNKDLRGRVNIKKYPLNYDWFKSLKNKP